MPQESEFLQSESWLRFQESTGRIAVRFSGEGFLANGIVHELPVMGKYLYVPRGPVVNGDKRQATSGMKEWMREFIERAREAGAKWIRIEPGTEAALEEIRQAFGERVVKAPHDVQPREIFVMDVSKPDEELLAGMKPKTRYNIRLAEKKGVRVIVSRDGEYREAFIDLVRATALRKRLVPHPSGYYRKMLDAFLGKTGKLFIALHGDDILGINLVVRHGDTALYLHGGSARMKRECMAPFLLQWTAIRDTRDTGGTWYDFGGVRTKDKGQETRDKKDDWEGITRFKTGFAPATATIRFPGAYDLVLDRRAYRSYDMLRFVRKNMVSLRKLMRS